MTPVPPVVLEVDDPPPPPLDVPKEHVDCSPEFAELFSVLGRFPESSLTLGICVKLLSGDTGLGPRPPFLNG